MSTTLPCPSDKRYSLGAFVLRTTFVILVASTLSFASVAQTPMKELSAMDMAKLATAFCARGAIDAAYALAKDRLPSDPEAAATVIAKSTQTHCVSSVMVDSLLPDKERSTAEQKQAAIERAQAWYRALVANMVKKQASEDTLPPANGASR
jgi:hypothetical protein